MRAWWTGIWEVAAAYKAEKHVVVAKVDADAHSGLGERSVFLQALWICTSVLSMVILCGMFRDSDLWWYLSPSNGWSQKFLSFTAIHI